MDDVKKHYANLEASGYVEVRNVVVFGVGTMDRAYLTMKGLAVAKAMDTDPHAGSDIVGEDRTLLRALPTDR
jgi:hypothetical protein